MASALGAVLSLIAIPIMPQGGSICLGAFVPVWVIAFRYGVRQGVFCGAVLGAINFIQKPIVVHPFQPVLDYLIAFGCLGLAALFLKKTQQKMVKDNSIIKRDESDRFRMVSGAVFSGFLQILCYIASGALFFSSTLGATNTLSAFYLSAVYNLSFGVPNLIVAVFILLGIHLKNPTLFDRR